MKNNPWAGMALICWGLVSGCAALVADLIGGVTIATAGYVELMQRQQQGWAYLRP